jgi:large subunit ribosomal protein L29
MKAEDLKTKTPDELQKLLMDTRKAQFNQRFQSAGGQLEKTHEVRNLRRTIARIKTFMSAKPQEAKAPKATKTTAKAAPKTKKSSKAAA